MPEQLESASQHPLQNLENAREHALKRLSRSPHPYHRQQIDLPHGAENLKPHKPGNQTPLRSVEAADDVHEDSERAQRGSYRGPGNSDSGTEADDEHFLKGLPAPKLRLHKGLRGSEGTFSSSPSPLASPSILEDAVQRPLTYKQSKLPQGSAEDEGKRLSNKLREKRRVKILRRTSEVGLLTFTGSILCLNPEMRALIYLWRREIVCQCIITASLVVIYPLRITRYLKISMSWKRPFPVAIPAAFDPAPLLYPPLLSMLVSLVLFKDRPTDLLPTIVLGISSLPVDLIPSAGGLIGLYTTHWLLSAIPILVAKLIGTLKISHDLKSLQSSLDHELLILIPPLHQYLSATLSYLTTTSLLPAELQLLSISLINLLLFARSPQMVILKSLLWGGGIAVLLCCGHVLRWGVALARVPKWRFRRAELAFKPREGNILGRIRRPFSFGASVFTKSPVMTDSSDDERAAEAVSYTLDSDMDVTDVHSRHGTRENGLQSATVFSQKANGHTPVPIAMSEVIQSNGRHTLPSLGHAFSPKSNKRTASGRRKRSVSSSVQSFFFLTSAQATIRKWLYASYVYICIIIIVLGGIREYVGRFALSGHEPIGWALGYLFGDLPWFRMQVVSTNLQRWICLPPRDEAEYFESCHRGWVEHLRYASFGLANTRLILCAYWLAIIIVGLAIVFRLSSVYEVDTRRKVFHFMMVAMLLPATYIDPAFAALALSLMLAIFLLLDLCRASQLPPLSKSLAYFLTPYVDGRDLKGPVVISHIFLLIGCAIPLWLTLASLPRTGRGPFAGWEIPTREVSMVSGVICVGMGDAAASLVGRRYGRRKWRWGGGKSIEGSIAFATAVALALALAKAWLRLGGWEANNEDEWLVTVGKAGIAAWVASLTEAVLTGGNDNVVVPVVLWLCTKGLDI